MRRIATQKSTNVGFTTKGRCQRTHPLNESFSSGVTSGDGDASVWCRIELGGNSGTLMALLGRFETDAK